MTANELADSMERLIELTAVSKVRNCDFSAITTMLRLQENEIKQLNFVLKNLTLATNKKINELEEEIEHLKNKVQYWKGLHR